MSADAQPASGYEVLEKVAAGGMATVYRGRRRGASGFSRTVAIKLPHDWILEDPVMVDSLQREAYVASRLHHANVVAVMDVAELNGRPAVIMEYIDGLAVSSVFPPYEDLPVDVGAALRVILDACAGVQAGHDYIDERGHRSPIIHRDISPQNLLVGKDGVSRVTDFGIAKFRADGVERTRSGIVKGKLGYLAPEYMAGEVPSVSGDQFSLAVVAWELLTGKRLFKASNESETMMMLLHGTIPAPSKLNPELKPFDAPLMRALNRRPTERFPSVREFGEALTQSMGGLISSHAHVGRLVVEQAVTIAAPSLAALDNTPDNNPHRRKDLSNSADLQKTTPDVAPVSSPSTTAQATSAPRARTASTPDRTDTASLNTAAELIRLNRNLRRPSWLAFLTAAIVVLGVVGVVVIRMRAGATTRPTIEPVAAQPSPMTHPGAVDTTATEALIPAQPIGRNPSSDEAEEVSKEDDSGASTQPPPSSRSIRRPALPRPRSTPTKSLSPLVVPSKAPPNPYAH